MPALEPVIQAIDFIETRLRAPVTVADIAGAVGYSLYHFCRVFGAAVRHSPYDYLMRRRMTLAAEDVLRTERKIVDIALDYQFETHEGFTRAFQRMCGMAPRDARRQGGVPAAARLPRLTGAHLACLERRGGLVPSLLADAPGVLAGMLDAVNRAPAGAGCPDPSWHVPLSGLPDFPASSFCLSAPLMWPDSCPAPVHTAAAPPGSVYACFRLDAPLDDLSLVLDWVRHAWLFYAPYRQSSPEVAVLAGMPGGQPGEVQAGGLLIVPVGPRDETPAPR